MIDTTVLVQLTKAFGVEETNFIVHMAKKVQKIEDEQVRRMETAIARALSESHTALIDGQEPKVPNFEYILMETYFKVAIEETAAREKSKPQVKLARRKAPTTDELKKAWAQYRKTRKPNKRQAAIAKKMRDRYLKTVKRWWEKRSEAFFDGLVYNQDKVQKALQKEVRLPYAQAQTIVRTETTRYQNQVRTELYEQSDDITHFLFMALRDQRTTKWCKTRHGIVLKKGSDIYDKNTPPLHWNCRSELLPLDRDNPTHQRIIADKSRKPENRSLAPLPKEFKRP
jgi:SPP1 gp7 family putative phage head morphogenesis protein